MKLEFVAKNGRDGLNPAANTGRFLNCYIEPIGGRADYQIRSVPGMSELANLNRAFMRALHVYDGNLIALCGGELSSIETSGNVTSIGVFTDSEDAGVSQNTGKLTIVSGGEYRTWDGTTLAVVSTGALTSVSSVAYIGGYTVVSERGGRRVQWSALANPSSFSGLDFKSAETTDEDITRIVAMKDLLFVFKPSGMELWQVTGQSGPDAFERVAGGSYETGLKSFGLVTTYPNGLAFIGNDGRVHVWGVGPVSQPQVEQAIASYSPSRLFYYEQRGHGFLCIRFKDAPAWCYDIATGEWHERAEGGAAWSAAAAVQLDDQWYVGTENGRVSLLTGRCSDNGAILTRTVTSMPFERSSPFKVASLEVFPRVGEDRQTDVSFVLDDGFSTLIANDARALGWPGPDDGPALIGMQTSRNGRVFGHEYIRDVGDVGEYDRRVVFRNLGLFDHLAVFRVNLSTATEIPLLSSAEVTIA